MHLAQSFASTPAGYWTAAFGPTFLAIMWAVVRRFNKRMDTQDEALRTITESLILRVEREGATHRIAQATARTTDQLARTVAVLRDRLDRHDELAQREHDRIMTLAERSVSQRQRPGG